MNEVDISQYALYGWGNIRINEWRNVEMNCVDFPIFRNMFPDIMTRNTHASLPVNLNNKPHL